MDVRDDDTPIKIRPGTLQDLDSVLALVKELAAFENAADAVLTSHEDYQKGYANKLFDVLIAELDGEVVGCMIYYYCWSTWKGKMMYLDDFVVRESHRRLGIGKLLMDRLQQIAREENCRLIKWQVLDWNQVGIKFYEKMGNAVFDKEWWDVKVYF